MHCNNQSRYVGYGYPLELEIVGVACGRGHEAKQRNGRRELDMGLRLGKGVEE